MNEYQITIIHKIGPEKREKYKEDIKKNTEGINNGCRVRIGVAAVIYTSLV